MVAYISRTGCTEMGAPPTCSEMQDFNQDVDWASLETHVTADGTFAPPTKQQSGPYAKTQHFPCSACNGTGRWNGPHNPDGKLHCFACKGKGFFLTSEADRQAATVKSWTDKVRALKDARDVFDAQYPGLAEWIRGAADWSDFARSMANALLQYGALTERQAQAITGMRAKCEQRRMEKAAENQAGNTTVDLEPIRRMFETAVASGYKKPIYRAAGLQISRAPDHGRNPGALYVTSIEDDDYLGKILGIQYTGKPAPALAAIALDPRGEAVRYGQRTGTCSCCGRTLTNHTSIEAGIGPICSARWGF